MAKIDFDARNDPDYLHKPDRFITHEWQLCPKCEGTGLVWQTGWPHTERHLSSSTAPVDCDVCNGKKIISKVNGLPPV